MLRPWPSCYLRTYVHPNSAINNKLNIASLLLSDVGTAKLYDSYDLDKLNELISDIEAIHAHDGGDCAELGMEGILRALELSNEKSHVIVLTDASCLDCEKKDQVIAIARAKNVKIHFFFSGSGCDDDDDFRDYIDVHHATGGVSVDTIESFDSLTLFITELRSNRTRSVRSTLSSSYKCQTFNVSVFTIKFELIINQNSTFAKIYDPLGYVVKSQHISDNLSGYISNKGPRNGNWKICTVDETSKYTLTRRDILDFSVDYYQDGHYSSAIPTAGMYVATYVVNHVYNVGVLVAALIE